eukprot:1161147-Pelagomonas_calceolata.AAC.2
MGSANAHSTRVIDLYISTYLPTAIGVWLRAHPQRPQISTVMCCQCSLGCAVVRGVTKLGVW